MSSTGWLVALLAILSGFGVLLAYDEIVVWWKRRRGKDNT